MKINPTMIDVILDLSRYEKAICLKSKYRCYKAAVLYHKFELFTWKNLS